jgi:protein SCO1/2
MMHLKTFVILLALALSSACSPWANTPTTAALPTVPPNLYAGEVVDPPVQLQDFMMPSSTGVDMRLSDLDGRWRLVFFGYLHCPDFCPLTLTEYRQVKRLVGDAAAQVAFVYISVDGVRDTPQALHDYLDNFDAEFIGMSGDDETLAHIQPDYGFYYSRRLGSDPQAIYTIDHSTRTYLIDPQRRLRATFTYDVSPEQIARAIAWYVGA